MHVLDVVGHPGHQSGHGIAGEKAQGHVLDVTVQANAQVVHDPVAGKFHDQVLGKGENENGHHHPHEQTGDAQQAGQVRVPQPAQGGPVEAAEVFQPDCRPFSPDLKQILLPVDHRSDDRIIQVNGQPPLMSLIRIVRVAGDTVPGKNMTVDDLLGDVGDGQLQQGNGHHQDHG